VVAPAAGRRGFGVYLGVGGGLMLVAGVTAFAFSALRAEPATIVPPPPVVAPAPADPRPPDLVATAEPAAEPTPAAAPAAPSAAKPAHAPPSARAPARAGPAELRCTTTLRGELAWAYVDVDGVRQGATPLTVKLEAGSHQLTFRREGSAPVTRELSVSAGQKTKLQVELAP
jgi:hypothetical protein